jgi:hypothetical protein
MFLALWSWEKCFKTLIRNLWEVFKCEHKKKLGGFAQIGISVKVDWVDQFWGFVGATPM